MFGGSLPLNANRLGAAKAKKPLDWTGWLFGPFHHVALASCTCAAQVVTLSCFVLSPTLGPS